MTRTSLALLALIILLGNGLRSVVASSIFMSEGSFASFLSITVEATAAVTELLMGAVLVSLLLAPWLMRRVAATTLALSMAALAGLAALGLAGLFLISPPLDVRVACVVLLFPVLGFALATLAPISQGWAGIGSARDSKLLLGAWSLAMPAAFLVTPQLVRIVAPRYGLDAFFAGFALVALGMAALVWRWRDRLVGAAAQARPTLGGPVLLAALAALVAFQAATITVSLGGLEAPAAPLLGALLLACAAILWRVARRERGAGSRRVPALFVSLFLLNAATTGFFDTSFLVLHSCSNTLIADRATLAALAQVAAATLATAILARFAMHELLIGAGVLIASVGLLSYLAYPGVLVLSALPLDENALLIGSRMITGFGTALATTATVFAVTSRAGASPGAALFVGFVIIIGTEVGLEVFEIAGQIYAAVSGDTRTPFAWIFLAQAATAALALVPLALADRPAPRRNSALAAE